MPKKQKSQKRKGPSRQRGWRTPQERLLKCILRRFWMLVVGFSVLLGIGVSFLSLSPDILVAPGKSFNLDNPLATPFMISDQGVLPLHSIQLWWVPTSMKNTLTGHTLCSWGPGRLGYSIPPIPILHRNEKIPFFCPLLASEDRNYYNLDDIIIRVTYRPDFLFWRQEIDFRFITGKIRWLPEPVSEVFPLPN